MTEAGRRTLQDFEQYTKLNVRHDGDFAVAALLDAIQRDRQSTLDQLRGAIPAIEAEARAPLEARITALEDALRAIADRALVTVSDSTDLGTAHQCLRWIARRALLSDATTAPTLDAEAE